MNTSRFLIALGVILCLILSAVTALVPADNARAQPADSAWPMFRQNALRTGGSLYSGPEVPKLKWSFTTGDAVGESCPAIGADGTIYVGSLDQRLYAINPDGSQKWSFTTGGYIYSSPAIGADGTIYVGSYDRRLYAINPDGSQKWSFTTGSAIESSPVIGADGTIYVGSYDWRLYAINPNGSHKWSFITGGMVYSSPAIGADGTIYVGCNDKKLYAINPDGSQKWRFTTASGVLSSPAIGADGTIYVGSLDQSLYAINPNGSQKWRFTTGNSILSSPAIGADGTIYVGSTNLYAVNPDGSQKWSFTTGGFVVRSSPAIGADGTIYVGCNDKKLYAINPNGSQKWSFTIGGQVRDSSPAIGGDRNIYVGSYGDHHLYAIAGEAECVTTATSTGTACFSPNAGAIEAVTAVATPSGAPVQFPHGMFSFKVTGLSAGQTITLNVTLPSSVPVGTKWYKYNGGAWDAMDIGSDDGDNSITVTLQEGVLPDDEDSDPNQITDQGGPGSPGAVGWQTYPISKVRVFLPWIALLAAVVAGALIFVRRRRSENQPMQERRAK